MYEGCFASLGGVRGMPRAEGNNRCVKIKEKDISTEG